MSSEIFWTAIKEREETKPGDKNNDEAKEYVTHLKKDGASLLDQPC